MSSGKAKTGGKSTIKTRARQEPEQGLFILLQYRHAALIFLDVGFQFVRGDLP